MARLSCWLPAALIGVASPLPTLAEPVNKIYGLTLEDLLKVKVFVASKTEQSITKAPSTVSLFTRQDIKRLGIKTVADILAHVPGFQVTRNDSNNLGHSFQARGRFTFSGNSVLMLLDNQRLNDEWTGGVNWTNHLVSTLNIKQIEVIRGPGSALYGSNAFNAVINIITDTTLNETAVELGSFDRKHVYLASANKLGQLDTSVFIDVFDDSGDKYHTPEGKTTDPVKGHEVSTYLKYRDFYARTRHVQREAKDFYQFGAIDNDINQTQAKHNSITLGYKYQAANELTLDFLAYHVSKYQKSYFEAVSEPDMSTLFEFGIAQHPSAAISGPLYRLNDKKLAVDGQYPVSDTNKLSFGLSYRRPQTKTLRVHGNHELADITNVLVLGQPGQISYYGFDKVSTLFGDEMYRTNIGLYLQQQVEFTPSLEATLGLRYDDYSDIGSATNPRLSLVYSHNSQHSMKLNYGEAFRVPSIGDLTVRNNPIEKANPNLLPEEVATSELAWAYQTEKFRFISTLYHSKFKNVHVHTPFVAQPPLTIRINRGSLEVSGLELEARTGLSDIFSLDFNWSHSIKLAENPQTLARNTASFALNANVNSWQVNLNGTYRDKVEHVRQIGPDQLERVNLDSYWMFRLNGQFQWSDSIALKFAVNNLFDSDYYQTFSSAQTLRNGMISRGREFSLGLVWQW